MVNNLVQIALELFGQQDCFKTASGNATPVKVLHPEGSSELQLGSMQQICLIYHW